MRAKRAGEFLVRRDRSWGEMRQPSECDTAERCREGSTEHCVAEGVQRHVYLIQPDVVFGIAGTIIFCHDRRSKILRDRSVLQSAGEKRGPQSVIAQNP